MSLSAIQNQLSKLSNTALQLSQELAKIQFEINNIRGEGIVADTDWKLVERWQELEIGDIVKVTEPAVACSNVLLQPGALYTVINLEAEDYDWGLLPFAIETEDGISTWVRFENKEKEEAIPHYTRDTNGILYVKR